MGVEWRLRSVAAERGIQSAAEVQAALADQADWSMTEPAAKRLLDGRPTSIRTDVIAALCAALGCVPSDLFADTPSRTP
jgi:putative transcriptional regulator